MQNRNANKDANIKKFNKQPNWKFQRPRIPRAVPQLGSQAILKTPTTYISIDLVSDFPINDDDLEWKNNSECSNYVSNKHHLLHKYIICINIFSTYISPFT